MLQRAAPPICGRLILLLSAVLTDSCVVDAPTPLAALETTPRPTRLVFGDGGPDAVALTVDLVSTIGCGESAWCAELLPLHFAAAGSSTYSQRPSTGVQGFPTAWPGAAVTGIHAGWKSTEPDAAHLVILLTEAGWFAVARPEAGGLGVLQMETRRRGDAARVRARRGRELPRPQRPGRGRQGRPGRAPRGALPRGGLRRRSWRGVSSVGRAVRRDPPASFGKLNGEEAASAGVELPEGLVLIGATLSTGSGSVLFCAGSVLCSVLSACSSCCMHPGRPALCCARCPYVFCRAILTEAGCCGEKTRLR